jgi:hypothetical protein
MWRSARNVRISYNTLPPNPDGKQRNTDLVEYESNSSDTGGVKTVSGGNTAVSPGDTSAWDWRGKGMLFFVTSHWEILGWGEQTLPDGQIERWAVTWFSKTLFTSEGIDIYCDRKEGVSEASAELIVAALKNLEAKPVATLVEKDLRPVEIKLPWKERK